MMMRVMMAVMTMPFFVRRKGRCRAIHDEFWGGGGGGLPGRKACVVSGSLRPDMVRGLGSAEALSLSLSLLSLLEWVLRNERVDTP